MMKSPEYCRLFGITAREAPICLLFRRGPSKWVQLIKWNTSNDKFEFGDWFHGRIYERRCDLSPNGQYLIYFASKFNGRTLLDTQGYTYAWTAVSRIPKLKAMLLWPKGDCWHGGGLFESNSEIWLNHKPDVSKLHPKHIHSRFTFKPNPEAFGEDGPVYYNRIDRDGWKIIQMGRTGFKNGKFYTTSQDIREKQGRNNKSLRMVLKDYDFKAFGGPYIQEFFFIQKNRAPYAIKNADWADLDFKGNLIFTRLGKVFRGYINKSQFEEDELINLNSNKPPKKQGQR